MVTTISLIVAVLSLSLLLSIFVMSFLRDKKHEDGFLDKENKELKLDLTIANRTIGALNNAPNDYFDVICISKLSRKIPVINADAVGISLHKRLIVRLIKTEKLDDHHRPFYYFLWKGQQPNVVYCSSENISANQLSLLPDEKIITLEEATTTDENGRLIFKPELIAETKIAPTDKSYTL